MSRKFCSGAIVYYRTIGLQHIEPKRQVIAFLGLLLAVYRDNKMVQSMVEQS
jgi:hypothetical protein